MMKQVIQAPEAQQTKYCGIGGLYNKAFAKEKPYKQKLIF